MHVEDATSFSKHYPGRFYEVKNSATSSEVPIVVSVSTEFGASTMIR